MSISVEGFMVSGRRILLGLGWPRGSADDAVRRKPKVFHRLSGRFLTQSNGTSAVEFAIIAPVFLLLVFGMIAYGLYLGAVHSVQQLAADAARTAIAGLDEAERKTLAKKYIELNGAGYALIDQRRLVVNVKDSTADGQQFVVALSYDARDLPIWNLIPNLPSQTIYRTSTIRVGGI